MIGVARHSAVVAQLDADTQPVSYTLRWPTELDTGGSGTTATPPAVTTFLSWSAATVNYWIYIPDDIQTSLTESFRIGGINFGYNASANQLYINEARFNNVSNGFHSILYQNKQGAGDTIIRVDDQLPTARDAAAYEQDDPLDSPTAYQPASTNQAIGSFGLAHRNTYQIPDTPFAYTRTWRQPQLALIRYSTQYLDLSGRSRGSARWTAWNDADLPGRDINGLWTEVWSGIPTKTVSQVGVQISHTYNWPTGFSTGALNVSQLDGVTEDPTQGQSARRMTIAVRWSPTNLAVNSYADVATA